MRFAFFTVHSLKPDRAPLDGWASLFYEATHQRFPINPLFYMECLDALSHLSICIDKTLGRKTYRMKGANVNQKEARSTSHNRARV